MIMIAGFGNPLMDVTVQIQDDKLLQKHNLHEDDQKQITAPDMKSLLLDISNMKASYSPGGSAQNTLRVLQWILQKPSTAMFGAIGDDELGQKLRKLIEDSGVQTRYIVNKEVPTGSAVALVQGTERSLVACLGAAEIIHVDDLNCDDTMQFLQNVDLIYMEAYFLADRVPVGKFLQEFCAKQNKLLAFNLSAPYMAEREPESMQLFARTCDILFGNHREYNALRKIMNTDMNPQELVSYLCATYENTKELKHGKIGIITNGSRSVMCIHSGGIVEEVDIPPIDLKEIVDTSGAGDAFVAGFLTGYFAQQDIKTCLQWGCWVARQIIKQTGCTIPTEPQEFLNKMRSCLQSKAPNSLKKQ